MSAGRLTKAAVLLAVCLGASGALAQQRESVRAAHELAARPVSIDVKGATVGSLLGIILAGLKGYRWSLREGVVHVTNPLEPPTRGSLLNRRIPRFRFSRVSLTEADRELVMSLTYVVVPGNYGIAGDYLGYNEYHPVGPLSLHNATVREILDALIKFPPGGAWVTMLPPRNLSQLPSSGLWKVVGYDKQNFQYVGDFLRQSQYPAPPSRHQ